jgi:two-component system response regulator BaeR
MSKATTIKKDHILIVEDEPKIASVLAEFLHAEGFQTTIMHDGLHVVERVQKQTFNLLILDITLPHKDGLTICKEIRIFSQIPVLMLTARVDEIDRLMGLGFGADDYVCKPFSAREVVARVQAILRRSANQNQAKQTDLLTYKGICLDLDRHLCKVNEVKTELTPVEFKLLYTLILKPGVVYSRDKLMDKCYDDSRIVSTRTIDSHMKNLRNKLIDETQPQILLHSIYGVGYKIE